MDAAVRGDDRPKEPEVTVPMAAQSAVLVPVPEAEPAVSRHRARLDRAAAWGVPAHATILYPFVTPPAITAATMAALAGAVASVRAFDCVPDDYLLGETGAAERSGPRAWPRGGSRSCPAGQLA
jgi:hypothetical protein